MAVRQMLIVDSKRGLVEAKVASDSVASAIGEHHAAIGLYLETGDESRLAALRGTKVDLEGESYALETDPETIENLALAGDLGYDDIYALE